MDLRNPNAGIDMSVRRSIMQVKMRKTYFVAYATIVLTASVFAERGLAELRGKLSARPVPRPALAARLAEGPEIIGIVHWGLNTYTDREWGYGDEDPAMLNPAKFDADQIVGACKAGGIGGLVVVAKHESKRNAALNNRLNDKINRLFYTLITMQGRPVYHVA